MNIVRLADPRLEGVARALLRLQVDGDCWTWPGWKSRGYGKISLRRPERFVLVHRLLYEELVGPVPDGLELDHLCRNRACANPAHLEPVTHLENLVRGETVIAQNVGKTHCKRGHLLERDNVRVRVKNGRVSRDCMVCNRKLGLARYHARRAVAVER